MTKQDDLETGTLADIDLMLENQKLKNSERTLEAEVVSLHQQVTDAQKEPLQRVKELERENAKLEKAMENQVKFLGETPFLVRYRHAALAVGLVVSTLLTGLMYQSRKIEVEKPVFYGSTEVMDKYQAEKAAREELEGKVDGLEADNARLIPFKAKHAQEVSARITLKRRVETLEAENKRLAPFVGVYEETYAKVMEHKVKIGELKEEVKLLVDNNERLAPFEGMYRETYAKIEGYREQTRIAIREKTDAERKFKAAEARRKTAEKKVYVQENNRASVQIVKAEWNYVWNQFVYYLCEQGGGDVSFTRADMEVWKLGSNTEDPGIAKQRKPRMFRDIPLRPVHLKRGKCSGKVSVNFGQHKYLLQEAEWLRATVHGKDQYGHDILFTLEGIDGSNISSRD